MKQLLFAVMLILPRTIQAQDIGLAPGATPPPVVIEDLDGNPVDLGQYIGKKPVLLEFWATWCPLCRALEPQLVDIQHKYGARVEILVIAVGVNQTPRSIKRHLDKHELPGRVLWDGKGAAVRAFMAPATSYVVLLDRRGRVVYTGSGSEQRLELPLAKLR